MAGSLIQELKRRNVFRVALVYIVVSWLLMQIGDVMFPALLLPEWTPTLLVAFLILGFPLVVVFAWAFELTPDGVTRTSEVPEEQSITSDTGRKINFMIIGVLALAVAFLLVKDHLRHKFNVWDDHEELQGHTIAVSRKRFLADRLQAVLPKSSVETIDFPSQWLEIGRAHV